MGKKEKEHRKKVAARNQQIKGAQQIEELRKKYEAESGMTQNPA